MTSVAGTAASVVADPLRAGSTTTRRARTTMWLTHAVMAAFWVLQTVIGVPLMSASQPLLAAALLVIVAGIQLRHSAAAARGKKPAGWPWSFAVLLAVVIIPQWSFGDVWGAPVWATTLWAAVASALMLVPRGPAIATGIGLVAVVWPVSLWTQDLLDISDTQVLVNLCYTFIIWFGGGVAIWASVELYRVIEQLEATTASISELAVARERLRQAADVHDLLGQNLTAIGLRANVGRRVATRDPDGARSEADAVAELAMRALGDLRAAAHGDRAIRFVDELAGASALLGAAAVDISVRVPTVVLEPAVETVLAWCLREASTNVVRHATPTWCEIDLTAEPGLLELHLANDGASDWLQPGNGLRGMAERAESIGGHATWSAQGGVVQVWVSVPRCALRSPVEPGHAPS